MNGIQQSRVFAGLPAAGGGSSSDKAFKRRKALLLPRCWVGSHDLRVMDKKDSLVVVKRRKLLDAPVMVFRRRVRSAVSFKQDGDIDVEPNSEDEDLVRKNDKGGFVNLVRSSITGLHPGSVKSELMVLALPAIIGQAIDPLAQLMETAYIGGLGPVELASAGVSMSIFNIISKLFNVPLLSITTSFVAEDISKHSSRQDVSAETISNEMTERLKLPSVSTALFLAAGIGTIEALALYLGSGLFMNMMGIPTVSPMYIPSRLFLIWRNPLRDHRKEATKRINLQCM